MEEDVSRQETNKLATNELILDNLELPAEGDLELADSEQVPDNLELLAETSLVLALCE